MQICLLIKNNNHKMLYIFMMRTEVYHLCETLSLSTETLIQSVQKPCS